MNYDRLQKYLGTKDMSAVEAMQKIDINSKGILYIVDENGRLLGSLTDGDIRRWLIKTANLNSRASDMMYQDVRFLFQDDHKKAGNFMKYRVSLRILSSMRRYWILQFTVMWLLSMIMIPWLPSASRDRVFS